MAGLLANSEKQKLTHQFCHYRQGTPQAACQGCAHYTGNSCQIVQNPIVPNGLCDFYVPPAR